MIATSIEQSKRLIEAGISPETADLYWYKAVDGETRLTVRWGAHWFWEADAWSLSALWNYIHNLDKTYDFPTTLSAEELIETLVNTIIYRLNERKAVDERSR